MLTDIVRFEWRYHTRQISFLAAALIYAGLGFALTATGFGAANTYINSAYNVTQSLGLASLAAVFAIAVFCASSVVRDREHQMEEIVFSTSVEKFEYLFGRFTGSFLAAFTAFSASAIGMLAALAMPWQDAARIGPIALHHYVWALLVLVLPGMLFAAALLFGVAALTRSMIATVVGAVAIYVFYFVAAALTNSPLMAASIPSAQSTPFASLLDPFGMSAFFEQTRHWTAEVRNTRLIALSGAFLLNRVLWIGCAAAVWWVLYRRFSFRAQWRTGTPACPAEEDRQECLSSTYAVPAPTPLLSSIKLELRSFLTSLPFLLLTLLWMALAFTEMLSDLSTEHGAALYPTTGFILETIQQPLTLVALVVIVYYSAEIVWRERMIRMEEVIHATPASNAVFVFSKWIALSALVLVLVASGTATASVVQLLRGGVRFEPGVMVVFTYFAAMPLILFAAAAVLIQTFSPNKYAGMLLVVLAAIVLRRYAPAPPVEYSAMNGFGHFATAFHQMMALWTCIAALLLLLTAARWRGKLETTAGGKTLAAGFAVGAIAIAPFILYESESAVLDWRAAYEKTYRRTAALPQPRVVAITADVALHPRERRYRIRGSYQLVNESNAPIGTVLVSVRREARVQSIALANAKLVNDDRRFAMRTFRLDPPLQPKQRLALRFDLEYAQPTDTSIVANGSYILDRLSFPLIGYRRSYEIRDAAQRKKRGLGSAAEFVDAADEWFTLDATLSTEADQIALTSGELTKQWTSGGRRYFHYRSHQPIHALFAIVSARYAVAKSDKVELYYHPAHRANVARILGAATNAMRTFEQAFGPYPHRVLRLAEIPAYLEAGGFATHGLIVLPEHRTFLIDARDPRRLDLVSRRVAHEVAHQWWGHRVGPPQAPGASAIVESLAKYSELLVLEKQYGRAVVRQSLAGELDLYLTGGTSDPAAEVGLARSIEQPYLYYRKGAIVMYALRDLLGESNFHRALRNFADEQGGPGHQPRFADLARSIHAAAEPQQRALVDRWLNEIVLYDLRLTSATAKPLPNGRFEVTMQVDARPLPSAEPIEIGLFTLDESPIAVAHHTLRNGANTIVMIANRQPELAIVDPYITRIDENRFDSERRITAAR